MSLSEKKNSSEGSGGAMEDAQEGDSTEIVLGNSKDISNLHQLGYKQDLKRNRSLYTLLFQSLAIDAIPYAFGGPLITAIFGGGQLPMFLGWIVVVLLNECVALSLAEIVSRYPTAAGPYYWSFQLAPPSVQKLLSFVTGWTWLIGNWTITLSVNFGFASLVAASIALFHPDFVVTDWQLLLIFYAICLITFVIVSYGNKILPMIDTIAVTFTVLAILATLICLSVKADVGRHSASFTLGNYDTTLSGWGKFSFFIGMIPAAYTFGPLGMVASMAEECSNPTITVPRVISLAIPVGGFVGLFFIIPICATMPPLTDIIEAPVGQALPYIYGRVMGSPGAGMALTFLILVITLFCSISITVVTSRCTRAFARDNAIPFSSLWVKVDKKYGSPIWALTLSTLVQLLLGLISLGSSSAFLAFVSVSVIALSVAYGIPIVLSMYYVRREVRTAPWKMTNVLGWTINFIAMAWIVFEIVLFSMPSVLPVDEVSMNYAVVVFFGFMGLSTIYYYAYAHKAYHGPPKSAGITIE